MLKLNAPFLLIASLFFAYESFATINNPGIASPTNGATISDHYARITANSATGITLYRFQVDSTTSFNSSALSDTTFSNRFGYSLNEFTFGTTLVIRMKVYSSSDSSDWSSPISVKVGDKLSLQAPTDGYSGDLRDVRWVGFGGSQGYELWADTAQNFDSDVKMIYRDIQNAPLRLAVLDSILFNQKYYWKVRTFFGNDTSEWSDVRSFTYTPTAKVVTPVSRLNYVTRKSQMMFQWDKQSMIHIEAQTSKDQDFKTIERAQVFDAQAGRYGFFENLDFEDQYYTRWRWLNKLDTMSWISGGNWRTIDVRLADPKDGAILRIRRERLQFLYEADYDTSHLQVALDTNFQNLIIDSFYTTTFSDLPDLNWNTKYYARLRMLHHKDTSEWTDTYIWYTIGLDDPFFSKLYPSRGVEMDPSFTFSPSRQLDGVDSLVILVDTTKDFVSKYTKQYAWSFKHANKMPEFLDFGKMHYYQFRVMHQDSVSEWSSIDSFNTWSNFKIDANYPPDGARNWNTSNNMIITLREFKRGYEFFVWQLDTTNTFNSPALLMGSDTTGKSMENNRKHYLGKEYYWRVAPAHRNDTGAFGDIWNFQSHISLLFEPKNNSVDVENPVTFEWSTSFPGLTGFYFQIDTSISFSNSNPTNISGGDKNELVRSDLEPGMQYYWRVRPYHEFSTGSWSTVYTFKTKDAPVLKKPSLLQPANNAQNVPEGIVNFRWNNSGVSGTAARLQISNNSNFSTYLYNDDVAGNNTSISGFQKDQKYYWRLRFKLNGNQGPWSDVFSFETETTTNSMNALSSNLLSVYPNPANDVLTIETLQQGSYFIFNANGKEVKSGMLINEFNEVEIVDLPKGVYSISIMSNRKIYNRSFVKN